MKRISAFFLSLVMGFGMIVSGLDNPTRAEAKGEVYTVTIDTSNRSFIWPVPSSSKLSSCCPVDYTKDGPRNHYGIDISANANASIIASAAGVVTAVTYNSSCGNYVELKHTINGKTYWTRYLHMIERSNLKLGESVAQGQFIGKVGNTGDSDGNHLHFDMRDAQNALDNTHKLDPGANTILPNTITCAGTYSCCNKYLVKITTTTTDTRPELLRSTVTALNHSRARAAEEARQRIGKKEANNGRFVNTVVAAAGAKSFSTTDNIAATAENYVVSGAFHSGRNNFTSSEGFRSVTAAKLNSLYQANYTPRVGDILLYNYSTNYTAGPERAGIVVGVSGTGITTTVSVIWQTSSTSPARIATIGYNKRIWGYCSPFYKVDDLGDFNCNGVVNATDASAFKNKGYHVTGAYQELCMNVDDNSLVNSADYTALNKQIADTKVFNGNALAHQVGRSIGTACEAHTGTDKAGYLAYGPYTTSVSAGLKTASFNLKIDNNSNDNYQVAILDVFDATNGKSIVSRTILRKEFMAANTYQSFQLHFKQTKASNMLEFRVYYCGNSALTMEKVTVRSNTSKYQAEGKAMAHQVGQKYSNGWSANVSNAAGFMLYGPYENGVPVGTRTATFRMQIDNNTADSYQVAVLSVFDATTQQLLATRSIKRNEFSSANTYKDFSLSFNCPSSADNLEYRVYYCRNSALTIDYVNIT